MARFPFLPQAEEWLKSLLRDNNIDIDGLVADDWVEPIRIRGMQRLLESIRLSEGVSATTRHDIHEGYGQMVEGLGFYYALLIVCSSFDERLVKRWVEGEASRADAILSEMHDDQVYETVIRTYISDIRVLETTMPSHSLHSPRSTKRVYEIPMIDFIEIAPRITGNYWTLANRPLAAGWVTMDEGSGDNSQQRLSRLVKERIRESLVERCRLNMDKMDEEFAARFAEPVGKMMAELQMQKSEEITLTSVHEGDWPPCMTAVISELASGENVNHAGRRFLTNMSRALALTVEEVHQFFVNAPDYKRETTLYQIGHLYQGEYTPEKCDTLKLNARCPVAQGIVSDRLCQFEWLTHPLKYVRAKQRRRARDQPPPESDNPTPSKTEQPKASAGENGS